MGMDNGPLWRQWLEFEASPQANKTCPAKANVSLWNDPDFVPFLILPLSVGMFALGAFAMFVVLRWV